jgi:hypothetical protein
MGNNADIYYMATAGYVFLYIHKWSGNALGINSATVTQSTNSALVSIYNSFTPSTTLPTGATVAPGIYSRNGVTVVQNALQIPSLAVGGIAKVNATTGQLAIAASSDLPGGPYLPLTGGTLSGTIIAQGTGTAISAPNGGISYNGPEIILDKIIIGGASYTLSAPYAFVAFIGTGTAVSMPAGSTDGQMMILSNSGTANILINNRVLSAFSLQTGTSRTMQWYVAGSEWF